MAPQLIDRPSILVLCCFSTSIVVSSKAMRRVPWVLVSFSTRWLVSFSSIAIRDPRADLRELLS
jgi:hypothetical protein